MEAEMYYTKDEKTGRYKEAGFRHEVMTGTGIWLLQQHKSGCSYHNIVARMADLPEPVEMADLAKCIMLEDM